jgi:hypothetical protein
MPTLTPIDDVATLSKDSIKAFEQKHACDLPDDYRRFLLASNGGFPSADCVAFREGGRRTASDVFCFFALGDERAGVSLEWHYDAYSDRLPKNTVPIARDSCGNLWLLRVGGENAGSVYFWDHGSYDTFDETDLGACPRVAAGFQEFFDNLGTYDASLEDGVFSRYSLVKQAAAAMSKKSRGFSSRANPGYVWHCDCDDDGNIKMQFVQYEIHAIATHTDGYSRLRAINGLIQEGPTRLPG